MKTKVTKFFPDKGFGFAEGYFFHISNIKGDVKVGETLHSVKMERNSKGQYIAFAVAGPEPAIEYTFDVDGLKLGSRKIWNPRYNDREELERTCPQWAGLPVAGEILKALQAKEDKKAQEASLRAGISAALEGMGLKVLSFWHSEIKAKFPDGRVRTWTVSDLDTQESEWKRRPYEKAMEALGHFDFVMSQPVDEDRYWNDDYNG